MPRPPYFLLVVTVTTLSAVIGHSQLPPTATNQPSQRGAGEFRFDASVPVCYIRLENGQVRDLRQLCGKKPSSLPSSRSLQRPIIRPDPDADDDDDSTPTAPSRSRTTPLQPSSSGTPTPQATPSSPSPQPTTSPLPGTPNRPTIVPSPVTPSGNPSSAPNALSSPSPSATPNPLAIPDDDSRY
ncbi:MAG: hypothetical protein ACAF41_07445 [Leptolyngbya sp. BL-A-14]